MTNEELKARYDSLRVQGTKTNKKRTEEDLRARYNYLQQMQSQPVTTTPVQKPVTQPAVQQPVRQHGVVQQPGTVVKGMNTNSQKAQVIDTNQSPTGDTIIKQSTEITPNKNNQAKTQNN